MTTSKVKYNVHIDNYINKVKNGEIKVSKEIIGLIKLVEEILNRDDVIIDHKEIEQIEKNILAEIEYH